MAPARPGNGHRKSILDLAPLECDCMNALWPLGEATVRDIRAALTATRPRAYTTIMTIMDRLAHKGVVLRRKVGRAYVYSANLSAVEARTRAVHQLVDNFFAGSADALVEQLTGNPRGDSPSPAPGTPRDLSAAQPVSVNRQATTTRDELVPARVIDETLL